MNQKMKDQETELILAYRKDKTNIELQEQILNRYKKFIWLCVHKLKQEMQTEEDLYQIGCAALFEAIDRFDCNSGYTLLTFAEHYITGYMKAYFDEMGSSFSVNRNVLFKTLQYRKKKEALEQKFGRPLTLEELQKFLKINVETIKAYQRILDCPVALDSPISNDTDSDLIGNFIESDEMTPQELLEQHEIRDVLLKYISHLPKKHQQVLKLRYALHSQTEERLIQNQIASLMHLSRTQVERIERQALTRLAQGLIHEGYSKEYPMGEDSIMEQEMKKEEEKHNDIDPKKKEKKNKVLEKARKK